MRENKFQSQVIRELKIIFPGCMVIPMDGNYIQGFPDLLILYKNKWAVLECKKSDREPYQPNQEYYIDELNQMSFASMICPENRERILNDLQQSLAPRRTARVFKP